jgi:hypothetical protein
VAVVELFTSEGCSSCPPADEVLAGLAQSADPRVYPLALHVNYWDELGWPDRFATEDNTTRQQSYARAFGTSRVYTPQAIVDGTEEFVGSDRERTAAAVARALTRPASVLLRLRPRRTAPDVIIVDYEATGASPPSLLHLAVVDRFASTSVRAGENAGKTLHHANVVRAFATVPLTTPSGSVTVHVPAPWSARDAELIGFVQRPASKQSGMPIVGAARSSLDTD